MYKILKLYQVFYFYFFKEIRTVCRWLVHWQKMKRKMAVTTTAEPTRELGQPRSLLMLLLLQVILGGRGDEGGEEGEEEYLNCVLKWWLSKITQLGLVQKGRQTNWREQSRNVQRGTVFYKSSISN